MIKWRKRNYALILCVSVLPKFQHLNKTCTNLFCDFTSKPFDCFQDGESHTTQTYMCLAARNLSLFDNAMTGSCQQLIRIIKMAKLFSLNNFPYKKHFFVEFFFNESYSHDLLKHIEIRSYEKRSILGWLIP